LKFIIDTSVWSLALRKKGPSNHTSVKKLFQLLDEGEQIFITGTILQEILQAFKSEATVKKVANHLESVPLIVLDRDDYAKAASVHRRCASKGISVSTTDCQISQAAITNNCLLLSTDRDFEYIARHTPLKLA